MAILEFGLRAPLQGHCRLFAGRPWTSDEPLELRIDKVPTPWPNAPVYQFPSGNPSAPIEFATSLSPDGMIAIGYATAAQVDSIPTDLGYFEVVDKVQGRVIARGPFQRERTNGAGGAGITPYAQNSLIVGGKTVYVADSDQAILESLVQQNAQAIATQAAQEAVGDAFTAGDGVALTPDPASGRVEISLPGVSALDSRVTTLENTAAPEPDWQAAMDAFNTETGVA